MLAQYCLLLALTLLAHSSVQAETRNFMTHFIKPFSYQEDGEIKGFAVAVVKQLAIKLKVDVSFTIYPFKRALLTVQKKPNRALFIVARRPERENSVKWVGPLITSSVYFYKRRGSPFIIHTLEDAKRVKLIGVGAGNADHRYLTGLGFTNLSPTNNQKQSLQMLNKKRIDLTPISEIVMPQMAIDAGIDPNKFQATKTKLYDSTLYIAFSIDTSDSEVQRWQLSLDQFKASGEYQKLYRSYIQDVLP